MNTINEFINAVTKTCHTLDDLLRAESVLRDAKYTDTQKGKAMKHIDSLKDKLLLRESSMCINGDIDDMSIHKDSD